jgi:hypothetical protein
MLIRMRFLWFGVDERRPKRVSYPRRCEENAGWVKRHNVSVDSGLGLALVPASQRGGVPEWLKGADCKSAGVRLRWFESNPLQNRSC